MIHATEKSVKEYGDKVSDDERKGIEEAIAALKTALEGDDRADIEAKTQALAEASGKLAERVYAEQGGGAGAETAESPSGAAKDEDVVDAEFEEVDQNKK
jgi:molecular chaperone DnaK